MRTEVILYFEYVISCTYVTMSTSLCVIDVMNILHLIACSPRNAETNTFITLLTAVNDYSIFIF